LADGPLYRERRRAGLCTRCGGKALKGVTLCEWCLLRERLRNRARMARAIDLGLCSCCGRRDPVPPYKTCTECRCRISDAGRRAREIRRDTIAPRRKEQRGPAGGW